MSPGTHSTADELHPILPDQQSRDRLLSDLDQNFLVEAAAGTGKTTMMVHRMVALLREGKCRIEAMAAVTFTRKAAAELRSRFQLVLEKETRRATTGPRKSNLVTALRGIDHCIIGTIHSFCARLLRERPVEAGVSVGFRELDEIEDFQMRENAWEECLGRWHAMEDNPGLGALQDLGLPIENLKAAFLNFAEYPDIEDWPSGEPPLPDLTSTIQALRSYARDMEQLWPRLPVDEDSDKLIRCYRRLPRMLRYANNLSRPADVIEILEQLPSASQPTTLGHWTASGEFTTDEARAQRQRWISFHSDVIAPALQSIRESRYGPVLQVLHAAQKTYDQARSLGGVLNYQDLLLKAAALLRNHPHVRRYFQKHLTHLLVDEFQDTDPVQAEVMILSTARDSEETDWRHCRPRPGSLFVVGDPKQSIYRFRRADIATYHESKRILESTGGATVRLFTNFRSSPALIDWVNRVFQEKFPARATSQSPAYVCLQPGRAAEAGSDLSGVRKLLIPDAYSKNSGTAREYEAGRIAAFIRHALDNGLTLPRNPDEIRAGKTPEADPSDFMIITRNTTNLAVYGRRLQEYGVPHVVTGGSAISESRELLLLLRFLEAVVHPEDPVALLTVLRSELFGISDAELYAFKKSGGRFHFQSAIPSGMESGAAESFRDAYEKLRLGAEWLRRLPPLAALEKLLSELGLLVQAFVSAGGDVQAGGLLKALEILRKRQVPSWSVSQIVALLARLVGGESVEKHDAMSVKPADQPNVRVMNLHKAKGLEAPVVFLADTSGGRSHEIELVIDRSAERPLGYLNVLINSKPFGKKSLAQPINWDRHRAREKSFDEAEQKRLLYVAATRAGAMLVISALSAKGKKKANPWQELLDSPANVPELEEPPSISMPVEGGETIQADEGAAARHRMEENLAASGRMTYAVVRAKEFALSSEEGRESGPATMSTPLKPPTSPSTAPTSKIGGQEWGSVIHSLLQLVMKNSESNLEGAARVYLAQQDLDPSLAPEAAKDVRAVMQSEIWRRALRCTRRLVEAPFEILLTPDETPQLEVPTLARGCIDLAFEEEDGWVLVDYKTDRSSPGQLQKLVDHYARQVRIYALAFERATGLPPKELGLYFLRSNTYARVPGGGSGGHCR